GARVLGEGQAVRDLGRRGRRRGPRAVHRPGDRRRPEHVVLVTTAAVDTRPRARRMALPAAVFVGTLAAAVVIILRDPNASCIYPTCPFLYLTGWYCPGCGSLRALPALTHLDV